MIYLASPFFNDEENEALQRIEDHLDNLNLPYFSPRKSAMNNSIKRNLSEIFHEDVCAVRNATLMIAFTDGRPYKYGEKMQIARDAGTSFEMGMYYEHWFQNHSAAALAKKGFTSNTTLSKFPNMVTVSSKGFGTNLMLAVSTAMHFSTELELMEFLDDVHSTSYDGVSTVLSQYRSKIDINKNKEDFLDEDSQ